MSEKKSKTCCKCPKGKELVFCGCKCHKKPKGGYGMKNEQGFTRRIEQAKKIKDDSFKRKNDLPIIRKILKSLKPYKKDMFLSDDDFKDLKAVRNGR